MYTIHSTKQEFYDWWKKQDHKKHTCADMVLFTLMKEWFKEVAVQGPLAKEGYCSPYSALTRAFTPHHRNRYEEVERALKRIAYAIKWPKVPPWNINTFKDVLNAENSELVSSRISNVLDEIRFPKETVSA